jgi:hypothetical protein
MRRKRTIELFSISFLDVISGALGAVIILYVAVPKAPKTPVVENKPIVEEAKTEIPDLSPVVEKLTAQNDALKLQSQEMSQQLSDLRSAFDELKDLKKIPQDSKPGQFDVGFRFKGKKIIFIVDTSRSMFDEDRMGQVKAGLKMLLTGMPPSYSVEIVAFPRGDRAPIHPFWGTLKPLTLLHKSQIFDFLFSLSPDGATPTRDVLDYVLQKYSGVSDIVLLTDGEPSLHNSMIKDDIYDLLSFVMRMNKEKVQISTIGVGGDVLKDQTSAPYQFLKLLAEQNQGFFVGF